MNTKKTAASSAATETKTASTETVKAAAKPAAEKKTAAKAAKPAAEKKTSAKSVKAAKPAAEKTTAAKAVTKAAPAKKAAAKSAAKSAAKTTSAKPAAAKKSVKKAAPVISAETICAKLEKKISKTKTAAIKEKIAVDIEVYGFTEGEASQKMYIEVNEGKAVVSPHSYETKDFRIAVSVEKALAFVDGKASLKDLTAASEGFYAEGNIAKAVKLAAIF